MLGVKEFTKLFKLNMEDHIGLFEERNAIYKNGWEGSGKVMQALFPNGVKLHSIYDHARFSLISMIVAKLTRYCINFANGGHEDSMRDLTVYANILFTFDKEDNNDYT